MINWTIHYISKHKIDIPQFLAILSEIMRIIRWHGSSKLGGGFGFTHNLEHLIIFYIFRDCLQ